MVAVHRLVSSFYEKNMNVITISARRGSNPGQLPPPLEFENDDVIVLFPYKVH